MAESKVEFSPPEGFVLPENVSQEGMFDAVCTIKVDQSGKLCLTKLGQTPMPGYDEAQQGQPKGDYKEYAKGMMSEMSQQQGGGDVQH